MGSKNSVKADFETSELEAKHSEWPSGWLEMIIDDLISKGIIEKPLDGNHGNIHPTSDEFVKQGIPFIMANSIHDGLLDLSTCNFITEDRSKKLQKGFSRTGDILLTHKGSVGNITEVPKIETDYIILSPQVTYYRVIKESFLLPKYLKFYFESEYFQNILDVRSGGGTRAYIGITNQRQLPVILPPLKEQNAIANILSTWDNAIQTTQKLISQKEQEKKWLIQNLLTGKKRLKRFEKTKWKKVSAGDVFKSYTKKGFENEELLSATQDRGIIPRSMLEGRVTMPDGSTSGYKLVVPGDFIISLRSFQGGLEYSYYRGIVSPAYIVLKPKLKINDEFYKQYFKSYEFIGRLATAVIGIRDGKQISYDDFCIVKIPNPSIEEQTAIAQVLQTADKEIKLLKTKLDQQKLQKKGLMQVLLTGKVRIKN